MRSGWRSCCCGSSTTLTSSAYERWCTTQTRSTSCRPAASLRSSPARRPLRPRNPVEASTLSRRAAPLSPPRRPVGSGVPQRRRALRRLARKGPLQGGRCAGLLCAGAAGRHHHRRRHHHHPSRLGVVVGRTCTAVGRTCTACLALAATRVLSDACVAADAACPRAPGCQQALAVECMMCNSQRP